MLYSFGRYLLPHLPVGRDPILFEVTDDVELRYYRLQRIDSGALDLGVGEAPFVTGMTAVGTGQSQEEKAPLSQILDVLNKRFGTEFKEEDRLFFQQIKERASRDERVIQTALANPLDKFQLAVRKLIEELMIERVSENDRIVTRYMSDQDFQGTAFPILAREIFDSVHRGGELPGASSE